MRSLFGMFKREAIPNGGWRTCQCVVPGLTRSLLSRKEGKKEREKKGETETAMLLAMLMLRTRGSGHTVPLSQTSSTSTPNSVTANPLRVIT